MDLTIDLDGCHFNVRVVCIIKKNGKILSHKSVDKDYRILIGGRIKTDEDSLTAVKREVLEELETELLEVKFRGIFEGFFDCDGKRYHEYMFAYEGTIDDDAEICKVTKKRIPDSEKEIYLEWVNIDDIKNMDFRPNEPIQKLLNSDDIIHSIF